MSLPRVIKNVAPMPLLQRQLIAVGASSGHQDEFEPDACATARVDCIREGGFVKRIDVHCTCGRVLQLICDYANDME